MSTTATTTIAPPAVGPCPTWCTDPEGHPYDPWIYDHTDEAGDVWQRVHEGPVFGPFKCFAPETSDSPGTLHAAAVHLEPPNGADLRFTRPDQLVEHMKDASRAAAWLASLEVRFTD